MIGSRRARGAMGYLLAAAMTLSAAAGRLQAGGFDRAIESAAPRVVKLYGLGAGLQAGYGTGILVSEDGLVLTVLSLLVEARNIRAVTGDGTRYGAEVVQRDIPRQLALLRLRAFSEDEDQRGDADADEASPASLGPFPYFELGSALETDGCTAELRPGDWVIAAGNPFKVADGGEPVSVAHGVFSTRTRLDARRRVRDFPYTGDVLVIDAITSNPGGEGSAVVNLDGEFVGMIGRVVVSNLTHTHFNYAMPCDVLRDFVASAVRPVTASAAQEVVAKPDTGFDSGIRIARTGYQRVLPFVERVRRGSPADRAGVRADDLILSVNGRNVPDVDSYDARMAAIAGEPSVELVIRRDRQILTVHLTPE